MDSQVAEAAFAVVRPNTDQTTRSNASKFLEEWSRTPHAWETFLTWMDSFSGNDYESVGTQLLCLQLLQSKIRSEVPKGTYLSEGLKAVHNRLWRIGQQEHSPLASPSSICTASLVVRCQAMNQLLSSYNESVLFVLRVLSQVPLEAEACRGARPLEAAKDLLPFVEQILSLVAIELQSNHPLHSQTSAQILLAWTTTCRVTLSELSPLIPSILGLLPNSPPSVSIPVAKSLTEALMVVADSCTETRQSSCLVLLEQLGRISDLASATLDDDLAHALATLCCTLVTEEVDMVVTHPSASVLPALLSLQAHPNYQVRMLVLDCWLTIQDVPMNDRHEDWKGSGGKRILECLIHSVAYPTGFTGWKDADIDESVWEEYRRLMPDVLTSIYFLLRSAYVEQMLVLLQHPDWVVQEVALFALVGASREVNARCHSRTAGMSIATDRTQTIQFLLQSVTMVLQGSIGSHLWLIDTQVNFIGAYATTWVSHCTPQQMAELIQFLYPSFRRGSKAAAKSFQSLAARCSSVLLQDSSLALESIHSVWQHTLSASPMCIEFLEPMATGCVRLLCQFSEANQYLHDLTVPLVQEKARLALARLNEEGAMEQLHACLHTIRTIIRFSDGNQTAPVSLLWERQVVPLLSTLSTHPLLNSDDEVLRIHEQLLKTAPHLVNLSDTLPWILERHGLAYLATAVELLGSDHGNVFAPLLSRIPPEPSTDFFQLCHRYHLYCPEVIFPPAVLNLLPGDDREVARSWLQFQTALFRTSRNWSHQPLVAQECWKFLYEIPPLQPAASECLATMNSYPIVALERIVPLLEKLPKAKKKLLLQDFVLVLKGQLMEESLDTYTLY